MKRKESYLTNNDRWVLNYTGKYFSYKDITKEEGLTFAEDNPTNLFKIVGVVLYHHRKHVPVAPRRGRYPISYLHFVVVSFDTQQVADVFPVKSFSPTLPEN